MDVPLREYRLVAEEAARAGGQILLQYRYQPLEIAWKARQEVVTNVDRLADQAISAVLQRYVPEHTVISEESGTRVTGSPFTWIIDPLDGTDSYVRGQRFSAVTVALLHHGKPLLGVVYQPFQNDIYTAACDGGATLNEHPLRVTSVIEVAQARLILDYSPRDVLREHLQALEWQRQMKQMFRLGGSVALNMCMVAQGAVEGYLYGRMRNRIKSWDMVAAALVVREAGGRVLGRQGEVLDTIQPQGFLLCCNGVLDLQTLFQGHAMVPEIP